VSWDRFSLEIMGVISVDGYVYSYVFFRFYYKQVFGNADWAIFS